MKERVFNLFLEILDTTIFELGVVAHDVEGTDAEKMAFLQTAVHDDHPRAKRYPVPNRYLTIDPANGHQASALRYSSYVVLAEIDQHLGVFEEIFEDFQATASPLCCITPVVNGELETQITKYL